MTTPRASLPPVERARKLHATVLQAMQAPGIGAALAVAMGVSESSISRIKNDHLGDVCQLLAHCGLKIVPSDRVCVEPEKLHALATLAAAAMKNAEATTRLVWDEE